MANKEKFQEKLKRLNNISTRDYILNYQHTGIIEFAACLLAIFCAFPIFYNIIYNLYDAVNIPQELVTLHQVFMYDNNWMYIIYFLSFFMMLLVAFQIMSIHYNTGLKECFHLSWIKDRWLPFCLAILLLWSFLSACFAIDPKQSFFGNYYRKDGFITFCIFALVFLTALLPNEKHIKLICEVLAFTGVITGFMVSLGKDNASLLFFEPQNIKNGIFANSNHYGYFLSICFPLLTGLIINDKKKNIFLILFRIAEFWLLTNAILVSNCRGSFIAIIVALVGWNIYVIWLNRSNWYKILFMDVLFVSSVLILHTESTMIEGLNMLGPQIQHAFEEGTDEALTQVGSNRLLLWKKGILCSFDKPIFGYGPDNLQFVLPYETTDKPHNELIEITASLGYPALIFYLAGLIGHAVHFFKNIKKVSILEVVVFSSVCCYFVSSLFGNVMFYTKPYFYLMLGFSYILLRRLPDAKPLFTEKKKKKVKVDSETH